MLVARTTDLFHCSGGERLGIPGTCSPMERSCSQIASEATFVSTRTLHLGSHGTNLRFAAEQEFTSHTQHNVTVTFQISKSTLQVQGEVIR